VTPDVFKETWFELSAGSHRILLPGNYRGTWYETSYRSIVGLRLSGNWGPTIDLRRSDFLRPDERSFRFHMREGGKKMESGEDYFEFLRNRDYYSEMPMWYPVGETRALGLTGDAKRDFLVRVVLALLSVGAVPAEVCSPMPYGWDLRTWEGMAPQAIADAIADRMMAIADPFEANVWWLEPEAAEDVRAARNETPTSPA
jgi:hypothetical protein